MHGTILITFVVSLPVHLSQLAANSIALAVIWKDTFHQVKAVRQAGKSVTVSEAVLLDGKFVHGPSTVYIWLTL